MMEDIDTHALKAAFEAHCVLLQGERVALGCSDLHWTRLCREMGTLEAVRYTLSSGIEPVLTELVHLKRPDLSISWASLQPEWDSLFSDYDHVSALRILSGAGVGVPKTSERASEARRSKQETTSDTENATSGSRFSWWRRRDWLVTGLLLAIVGLLIPIVTFFISHSNPSSNRSFSPIAASGYPDLPSHILAGSPDVVLPTGSAPVEARIPISTTPFQTPHLTGTVTRRYCGLGGCQFVLYFKSAFTGSSRTFLTSVSDVYYSEVYPPPDVVMGQPTAGDVPELGTGSIVINTQFLAGWFCIRVSIASGGSIVRPRFRTPWSSGECYDLDTSGNVVHVAQRT